jgi:hypothetical protein
MPVDNPTFSQCVGYEGQMFEDRHGVFNLTLHTRGPMAGVTHVEGDVTANFVISPLQGPGWSTPAPTASTTWATSPARTSTSPHPPSSFYLHATGTGTDGSQIRFTVHGHFVIDKRTGEVRRDVMTVTCRVS